MPATPTSDRVAVVTGAGRGIGRAVAERLAGDGFRVVAVDIDGAATERTGAAVAGSAYQCDVSDADAVRALADRVGTVDVLVNNAGVWQFTALADVTPEHFYRVMSVNVLGTLLCTQAFAPGMARRGSGAVVNLSSVVADHPHPRFGVYPASKAAIIALTKQAAMEYADGGIRVNAVAPGYVLTEGTSDIFGDSERAASMGRVVPVGRLGTPRDVADAVAFLVSDAARYVSGQVLGIDGGLGEAMFRTLLGRAV